MYGIYDAAKLVESKASSKKDYLILQEVFTKLVEQDPSLYEARIWLAKSIRYTNLENALDVLKSVTTKLNADWRSVYRSFHLISKIYVSKNDSDKANNYRQLCLKSNPKYPVEY